MADSEKKNHDENLFQIMDGIISQLNKTKKMFIIMILTLLILPPISFVITFALLGPPMFFGGGGMHPEGFGPGIWSCKSCAHSNFPHMVRDRHTTMVRTF